ncbi:MAG: hypothetical protein ACJAXL_001493, partial [Alphaproteobacteria bacterium]
FQELEISTIPSLDNFIKSDMFTNKPDRDIELANQLGIFLEDIINKGAEIGISPIDILHHIQTLRCALILKKITQGCLTSNALGYLYRASIASRKQVCEKILRSNQVKLSDNMVIEDIMLCANYANHRIFRSIYLNS